MAAPRTRASTRGTASATTSSRATTWLAAAPARLVTWNRRRATPGAHGTAFSSLGTLHPNYRTMYESWAQRWATLGEGRSKHNQGALVRCWMARASVAIQRAQFYLVRRMRAHAEGCAHRGQPRAWQLPDISDVDAQRVCCSPLEGSWAGCASKSPLLLKCLPGLAARNVRSLTTYLLHYMYTERKLGDS